MTRVLLLEAAGPESGAIAATATARGYQIYAVTDPDQHATYTPDLHTALSGCLLTDFTRPAYAAGEIIDFARRNSIDAC
ncbi:hypothetical protein [Actinokineospora sp.]|uniref:hypothetical protein n=1 Tax=Actinokineospora sp. TaxID=1872133 RepID=UPI003D6BCF4C